MKRILSFVAACLLTFAPLTALGGAPQWLRITEADLTLPINEGYYASFITEDGSVTDTIHYVEDESISFSIIEAGGYDLCVPSVGYNYEMELASMLVDFGAVSDSSNVRFLPIDGTETYALIDEICAYHGNTLISCSDVVLHEYYAYDDKTTMATIDGIFDAFYQVPIAGILTLKNGKIDSFTPYDIYTQYLSYHSMSKKDGTLSDTIDVFITDDPILRVDMNNYHDLNAYSISALPSVTASLERRGERTVHLGTQITCLAANIDAVPENSNQVTPSRPNTRTRAMRAVATTAAAGTLLGAIGSAADNRAVASGSAKAASGENSNAGGNASSGDGSASGENAASEEGSNSGENSSSGEGSNSEENSSSRKTDETGSDENSEPEASETDESGTVPTGSRSMEDAIEDAQISVEGLTEKLIHAKDAHVVFPISNEDGLGLKWHYLCKTLVGEQYAGARCVANQLIISPKGETMEEDEQLISILLLGWAIDPAGKIHKGFTGFEVTMYRPGLVAAYNDQGDLEVELRENSNVKGILQLKELKEGEYTIEGDVIRLVSDPEVSCPVPEKEN